jgi:hypothetical protein
VFERIDVPTERRMTRTHAILWAVILLATVLDVITTLTGLSLGLQEGNVVARTLLASLGIPGFWLLKFAAMAWLVAGWALLSDRNAAIFLALYAVVAVATVVANVATLLSL